MKMKAILLTVVLSGIMNFSFAGDSEALTMACKKGDLAGVQKAIADGADLNAKNKEGWNPISAAFFWPEITQVLLEKGADANGLNGAAMGSASRTGSSKVIELLLKAGADPNKTNTGTAPIQNVVDNTNCIECLELLLQKGAKVDMLDGATGGNLLDELAMSYLPGQDRVNNDKPQIPGWESMGFVVPEWYKNPDISKFGSADAMVKMLVKAGVDINAKNKLKNTPLLTSLGRYSQTKPEIVLALVNNGADVNVESPTQGYALLQAAGHGFTEVLEVMLAKGANLNQEYKVDDWVKSGQRMKGINPLMWAAMSGKLDAVKLLVSKGAKLDEAASGNGTNIKTSCVTSVKNKTAIFFAIESGDIEIVKYLVENTNGDWKKSMSVSQMKKTSDIGFETKTTCFDNDDYSPSQYAKASGMDEIANYLKSKKL